VSLHVGVNVTDLVERSSVRTLGTVRACGGGATITTC
jgi:hypothetical protein